MKIKKSSSGGQLRVAQTATPKLLGRKSNNPTLKNDGWKTILSFLGARLIFRGEVLNFQGVGRNQSLKFFDWLLYAFIYMLPSGK